jgi:RNA polymerase sigma-70 factor (ECF subfamily)
MEMSLSRKRSNTIEDNSEIPDIDELFFQHWERICNVIYRLVGDWDEAEDIALNTFLKYHQSPPRTNENIGGWLYRVATNLGLNALRGQKRRQQYEERAGNTRHMKSSLDNPAEILERKLERQRVQTILRIMKPRSAQLLVLRHSGFAYAEIAEILDISRNSVGTLLSRAEREFERLYESNRYKEKFNNTSRKGEAEDASK